MYRICILLLSVSFVDSARILCAFLVPSSNHQIAFRTLTDELIQKGHDLVVVTANPGYAINNQSNIREIDVSDKSNSKWEADMTNMMKRLDQYPHKNILADYTSILENEFKRQFETEGFQKIIKEEHDKFDLVLLEIGTYTHTILTHLIKAPFIMISSSENVFDTMGNPEKYMLYPNQFKRNFDDMSILVEIYDIYNAQRFKHYVGNSKASQYAWFKSVLGHEVTNEDTENKIDMLMLNEYSLWDGIRPMTKSVVHLGGLHIKPSSENELPQDLQKFFNSSTKEVIYVSLGTSINLSYLFPEKIEILVKVLSEMPYNVLWQWNKGELQNKGDNVIVSKTLPQADLLRHPKVKLFITDGDFQSTDESISAGVPVIVIPFLGDQFLNSENYVRHKIGIKLDINTLTEDGLKTAVLKVLTDKGYRENVFQLRTVLRDKPMTSLNQAVSWIEYVIRNGGAKHLRSPCANMNGTSYMEIELIAIATIFFVLLSIVIILLLSSFFNRLWRSYRRYNHRSKMLFPR